MKTLNGIIKSDKMSKTVVVEVAYLWQHPLYQKRIKKTKRYLAHNEKGAVIGDKVTIAETKPLSKNKHWTVTEINQ